MSAHDAWYQAQYIVGKTAVLDYILEEIVKSAKEGNYSINWRADSICPASPPIREFFNNKEVREYVLVIITHLGYQVDYDEGMYGYIRIAWGPSEPPEAL